ncbi:MAG: hypothetical protein RIC80_17680 [Cyclobacteriaceae bacterium]
MSAILIEKACLEAKEKLETLGVEPTLQEELAWVIGSYNYDSNPVGLYEIGGKALDALKDVKKGSPRKVSKKLIDTLEKAISEQN